MKNKKAKYVRLGNCAGFDIDKITVRELLKMIEKLTKLTGNKKIEMVSYPVWYCLSKQIAFVSKSKDGVKHKFIPLVDTLLGK